MKLPDAVKTLNDNEYGAKKWETYTRPGDKTATSVMAGLDPDAPDVMLSKFDAVAIAVFIQLEGFYHNYDADKVALMVRAQFGNVPAAIGAELWKFIGELLED